MSNKIVIKNGLLVTLTNLLCALIVFLCIPQYSKAIGPDDFEHLTLFWTSVIILNSLDFGIIYCIMVSDRVHLASLFVKSSYFLTVFQVILGLALFIINYLFLDNIYNFLLFIFLPIGILANISKAFCERQGMFLITSLGALVATLISFVAPLFIYKDLNLADATFFYLIGPLVYLIILSPYTFNTFLYYNNNRIVKISTTLKNGKFAFFQSILNIFFTKIDRYSVSYFLGTFNYNNYYIANEFVSRLSIVPISFMRVLMPRIVDNRFNINIIKNEIKVYYILLIIFGFISLFSLFFLGAKIITLWGGSSINSQVLELSKYFYIGLFFNVLAQIPFTVLQAYNKSGSLLAIYCMEIPFYALLLILASLYDVSYVACIWSFRAFIDFLLLHFKMTSVLNEF